MDMILHLDPETERLVREEAARRGVSPEQIAEEVVAKHALDQQAKERAAAARALFAKWAEEDKDLPDSESLDDVFEALNEGRKGYRLLFPPELKGKTW